jgi:hypothetical protein
MACAMFPAWRLQLREARLAVADGRWDEAAEMLASETLREFLPAKRLSQQLAGQLVARARQRMQLGQSTAGWRDLDRAARLGVGESEVGGVRHDEAQRRLTAAIEMLARGEAAAARQALERMEHRRLGGNDRRTWQMIAQHLETSNQRTSKGDLPAAIDSLEQAKRLLPAEGSAGVSRFLEQRLASLRESAAAQHALDARLHTALAAASWTEVLAAAEALLELAPQHSAARQARQKAWQAVGMDVTMAYCPPPRYAGEGLGEGRRNGRVRPMNYPSPSPALRGRGNTNVTERQSGKRIVAWIDSVGGYLICTGDEIVLGQPSAEGGVDVPILGDLSRRHAVIRRDREAYVLTPLHRTAVDGRAITEPTVLRDKATIRLGDGVELHFRKPHALSATAVLELASHHRTEPAVDGIVLMSESCILGPQPHSHIRCRNWTGDLVLFRRGDELMCRTHAPVEIDGQTCVGQAAVSATSRMENEDFALSLEEI